MEIGAAAFGVSAFRLASEGVETTGVALHKEWRESTDSDGHRSVSYYVRFAFDTWAGERVEDEASVQRGTYNGIEIGDPVPVRYWPDDPELNEIEPGSRRLASMIMGAIGLPFFLVGGFFTLRQARFARNAVRLRDGGEELEATVTDHVATAYKVNNRRLYALEWKDERGNVGRSRPMGAGRLADFFPGTRITVYADPSRPERAVWQGDVGVPDTGYGRSRRSGGSVGEKRSDKRPPTVRRG